MIDWILLVPAVLLVVVGLNEMVLRARKARIAQQRREVRFLQSEMRTWLDWRELA